MVKDTIVLLVASTLFLSVSAYESGRKTGYVAGYNNGHVGCEGHALTKVTDGSTVICVYDRKPVVVGTRLLQIKRN